MPLAQAQRTLPRADGLLAVFRKEWRVVQRQGRAWWNLIFRVLFALAFVIWTFLVVFQLHANLPYDLDDILDDLMWQSNVGAPLMGLVLALQVVPALVRTVAQERESGALDLLLTTRLRTWEILAGKLLAPLAVLGLMLAPAVVVMAAATALVGEDIWALLEPVLLLCLDATAAGTLTLACSVVYLNAGRALTVSLVLYLLMFMLPVLGPPTYLLPVVLYLTLLATDLLQRAAQRRFPRARPGVLAFLSFALVLPLLTVTLSTLIFRTYWDDLTPYLPAWHLIAGLISVAAPFWLAVRQFDRLRDHRGW